MKEYFYLMAENGYKPTFKHENLDDAITEAKRLITEKPNLGRIEVLKSFGFVQWVEVPVTKRIIAVDMPQTGLPF